MAQLVPVLEFGMKVENESFHGMKRFYIRNAIHGDILSSIVFAEI